MPSSKTVTSLGQNRAMLRVKAFVLEHFERILVIVILAVVAVAHFWFARGVPILFFYFLPALVAGYVLGKRNALMTAIFSILAVAFAFITAPETFTLGSGPDAQLMVATDLAAWGGFLILAALVTGQLYEDKENRIQELRSAYLGILQVLARYLDSPEGPTKGHCLRVANLSAEIARAMGLPNSTIDNVHAAALLHDIEMSEGMSGEVIHRAALLSENDAAMKESAGKTGEILSSVGTVLKEAIPLIRYHSAHARAVDAEQPVDLDAVPQGARIVSVADAYDQLVTDKPYATGRAPWVAVKEIEKGIGTRYDRQVVEGLKSVVAHRLEQDNRVAALAGAASN
ncbi:MAG TPA: HD domain-containing phosphohydrolase [Planctomycetota bacterium]|nr:HD domain-containing phosphohydrolase [Planctomycetota bacterium]